MKFRHFLSFLLPNLTLILALSCLTLMVLDWYNPMMAVLTNTISTRLLLVLCILSAFSSLHTILKSTDPGKEGKGRG